MKLTEHEKRYRNSTCWRRIPPAEHELANDGLDERERIWYQVVILIFIIIAVVAVYIADNTISQYAQLLQEVKQR
jgi:hypothetical protein